MLESIEFTNFKALRKTTLLLAPFTLLLGPNGSGKSSVLQALQGMAGLAAQQTAQGETLPQATWRAARSVTIQDSDSFVEMKLRLRLQQQLFLVIFQWHQNAGGIQVTRQISDENGSALKHR